MAHFGTWLGLLTSALAVAEQPVAASTHIKTGTRAFDEQAIVSQNDVVYETPSVEPCTLPGASRGGRVHADHPYLKWLEFDLD